MRHLALFLLAASVLGLGSLAAPPTAPPTALPRAHAHNDYEHIRPLLDALDQGFGSVEADVHLVDGELLVAHDRKDAQPGRTLETLYLAPLRERARTNGGVIFPGLTEFTLLVDVKADAAGTYAVLRPLLERYRPLLTRFTATNTTPGAVTIILSGDRPTALVEAQPERLCAIDGRLEDLKNNPSLHLIPLVSDSWRPTFSWIRNGELPEADRARLRALVEQAHAQGRRIRFWGVEDQPSAWRELEVAGVDLINTDNLAGLRAFLVAPGNATKP